MTMKHDMRHPVAESRSFSLSVVFERREDGGLRVYSDDLPGLVLSNADPEAVLADIRPAIEVMLGAIFKTPVTARELVGLREELEHAGVMVPDVPMAICGTRKYVAHLC